jgi:hypothetical protein
LCPLVIFSVFIGAADGSPSRKKRGGDYSENSSEENSSVDHSNRKRKGKRLKRQRKRLRREDEDDACLTSEPGH